MIMKVEVKDREIREKKRLDGEYRRVLQDTDDRHEHKQKLCIKQDAENIVDAGVGTDAHAECMPRHKPDDGEECRGSKHVMRGVMFRNKNNTENPY